MLEALRRRRVEGTRSTNDLTIIIRALLSLITVLLTTNWVVESTAARNAQLIMTHLLATALLGEGVAAPHVAVFLVWCM